jgi:hypothetical protein
MSLSAFSDSSNKEKKEDKRDEKNEFRKHPIPLSIFDVIPLNSPIKGSLARFLLKVPIGFNINEVKYVIKNAGHIFEKLGEHKKINLIDTSNGKELQINVSKLPPGFYQLFVKVKDKNQKEHEFKTKLKDHAMFVIDNSLQVPLPDTKLNDKTVAGIDSDGDGIRDDIQRWINEEYAEKPKEKMAMKQFAMGAQLRLTTISNKIESIQSSRQSLNSHECMDFIAGHDQSNRNINAIRLKLLNTKDRLYADIKSDSNFSGEIYRIASDEESEKALCKFNPDTL